MLKKTIAVLVVGFAVGFQVLAPSLARASEPKELTLNCINTANERELEGYLVFIGNEQEVVALRESSSSQTIVKHARYAVIVDGFQGDGEFVTRGPEQFELTPTDESGTNFSLYDRVTGKELVCSVERTVHACPALTVSN
jgi:hypothetical protein